MKLHLLSYTSYSISDHLQILNLVGRLQSMTSKNAQIGQAEDEQ